MAQQPTQRTAQPQRNRSLFSVRLPPQNMSVWSSPQVPDSSWADQNFLLGAGMVLIQQTTRKVVVVYERQKKYWFLPKGRKDIGESLEQAALREAYEESGYRVEFLPLYTNSCAPIPPANRHLGYVPNCEPIFINTTSYRARQRGNWVAPPGEYLTFWYVGQIPEDAVREEGTGMPDEVNYETHLVDVHDAVKMLFRDEARVVNYAWTLFEQTCKQKEALEAQRLAQSDSFGSGSTSHESPSSV